MRKTLSLFFVMTMLVLSFVIAPQAAAAGDKKVDSNRYNVMVVMDSSGSLADSDPDGNRFEAVNQFIGLTSDDGNELGGLTFSDDVSTLVSLSSDLSNSNRLSLCDQIASQTPDGYTNIGSALEAAVGEISKNGNPDIPSVILFFSDGNTEMRTQDGLDDSLTKKADAIQIAQKNGIAIYSVCLNADGSADVSEMQQISSVTNGKFVEINSSEDLQNAYDMFYNMIYGSGTTKLLDGMLDSQGKIEADFYTPGIGVSEINIIVRGAISQAQIYNPNSSLVDANSFSSKTFTIYKVSDTTPGKWHLVLIGQPDTEVKVDMLFNTDLKVLTSADPSGSGISPDDTLHVGATICNDTETASKDEDYSGFEAKLNLKNIQNELIKEYPMQVKDGKFSVDLDLDEGIYNYDVTVSGYNITRTSAAVEKLNVSNDISSQSYLNNKAPVPVSENIDKNINLWPFKKNVYVLKTDGLATDPDGDELTYKISQSAYVENEDYTFDGNTFTLSHFSLKKGTVVVTAYDKYGASCNINVNIRTKNIGLITVIVLGALIVLVLIALGIIVYLQGIAFFNGSIMVKSMSDFQEHAVKTPGRGRCRLNRFTGLPDCGLNYNKSYFQATGRDHIYLVADKKVKGISGKPSKIIRIDSQKPCTITVPVKGGESLPGIDITYENTSSKPRK